MQRTDSTSYLKAKVRLNSRFLKILLIFMVIGTVIPSILFSIALNILNNDTSNLYSTSIHSLTAIGFIMMNFGIISIVMGMIFLPAKNFTYLINKKYSDMFFSLPITKKERFKKDFLAGILFYVIPIAICSLISVLILYPSSSSFLNELLGVDYTTKASFGKILRFWLDLNITSLFTYCVSVFVVQIAGNMLDYLIYLILTMISVPIDIFAICQDITAHLSGTDISSIYNPLFVTSPIGFFFNLFYKSPVPVAENYIVVTIFILLTVFLSYYVHMKRKAEHTGKQMIFSKIIMFLIFSLGMLFGSFSFNAPAIISAIVAFLIIMLIITRGKLNIIKDHKKIIAYVLGFISIALFGVICSITNSFGLRYYHPSLESTEKIEVNGIYNWSSLDFTNKENIKKFMEYDTKENIDEKDDSNLNTINITFYCHGDKTVSNTINLTQKDYDTLQKEIFKSDEFPKSVADKFESSVRDDYKYGIKYQKYNGFVGTISYQSDKDDDESYLTYHINKNDFDNYIKDMKQAIIADYSNNYDSDYWCLLDNVVIVDNDYKNLKSVMGKYKIVK